MVFSPQQEAALSGIAAGAAPVSAPAPVAAPGQEINEVAVHLANATEALLRTGATDENKAAIGQFLVFLSERGQEIEALEQPQAPPIAAPTPAPAQPGHEINDGVSHRRPRRQPVPYNALPSFTARLPMFALTAKLL